MNDQDYNFLNDLASQACDGPLSESDQQKLEELLNRDEAARDLWLSYARLHTNLFLQTKVDGVLKRSLDAIRHSMSEAVPQLLTETGSSTTSASPEKSEAPVVAATRTELELRDSSVIGSLARFAGQVSVVAAALLVAMFAWQWLQPPQGGSPADEANSLAESPSKFDLPAIGEKLADENLAEQAVARIVRKVDCDWEGDRWTINSSSKIVSGQTLKMSRGLMELEFSSGAQVTLEAPVSFTIESPMRAVLTHGKLTALVPEQARGFTVTTPDGDAIDLGTEFGLLVGDDGVTETHVFKGEVSFLPAASDLAGEALSLTDDMALQLTDENTQPSQLRATPTRFTRVSFADQPIVEGPAVDRELSVWLAAGHRVQLDESGRVATWGDLSTKSNTRVEDAWQVEAEKRPLWREDGIGNLPALEFEGSEFLVTEPVALGTAHTLVAVIEPSFALDEKYQRDNWFYQYQILNLNGPPNFVLRFKSSRTLACHMYTGRLASTDGSSRHFHASRIESEQPIPEEPLVAIAIYDPSQNRSRLYGNGVLLGEDGATEQEESLNPRYIGNHMYEKRSTFCGKMAEVMIYNTGLDENEVQLLNQSLMEKYAIAPAKQE